MSGKHRGRQLGIGYGGFHRGKRKKEGCLSRVLAVPVAMAVMVGSVALGAGCGASTGGVRHTPPTVEVHRG